MKEKQKRVDLPLAISGKKWFVIIILVLIKVSLFFYWSLMNKPVDLRYDKDRIFFDYKSGSEVQMNIWLKEIEAQKSSGDNDNKSNFDVSDFDLSSLIGSKSKFLIHNLIDDSVDEDGIVRLSYSVDVLPDYRVDFGSLVPKKYMKRYRGLIREFVFTFYLKTNSSINSEHRCRIFLDDSVAAHFSRYAFERRNTSIKDRILTTNLIDEGEFNLLVIMQKMNGSDYDVEAERVLKLSMIGNSYVVKADGGEPERFDTTDVLNNQRLQLYKGIFYSVKSPLNKQFEHGRRFLLDNIVRFNSISGDLQEVSYEEVAATMKYEAMSHQDKSRYTSVMSDSMYANYVFDMYGNFLYNQTISIEKDNDFLRVLIYKI